MLPNTIIEKVNCIKDKWNEIANLENSKIITDKLLIELLEKDDLAITNLYQCNTKILELIKKAKKEVYGKDFDNYGNSTEKGNKSKMQIFANLISEPGFSLLHPKFLKTTDDYLSYDKKIIENPFGIERYGRSYYFQLGDLLIDSNFSSLVDVENYYKGLFSNCFNNSLFPFYKLLSIYTAVKNLESPAPVPVVVTGGKLNKRNLRIKNKIRKSRKSRVTRKSKKKENQEK